VRWLGSLVVVVVVGLVVLQLGLVALLLGLVVLRLRLRLRLLGQALLRTAPAAGPARPS
jgi:hypothetical protein